MTMMYDVPVSDIGVTAGTVEHANKARCGLDVSKKQNLIFMECRAWHVLFLLPHDIYQEAS